MLYKLISKLMSSGDLYFGDGEITFFNQQLQLVDPSFFAHRLRNSDDFWTEARLQYESMKEANTTGWFAPVSKEKSLEGDNLLKWAINYFELAGWGKMTVEHSQFKAGRGKVKVEDSAVATSYLKLFGGSEYPVCNLTRGGVCGGGNYIEKRDDLEMVETKCIAKGDPFCEIVIKPRSEFSKKELNEYGCQFSSKK